MTQKRKIHFDTITQKHTRPLLGAGFFGFLEPFSKKTKKIYYQAPVAQVV
jgi:hypothetical protein